MSQILVDPNPLLRITASAVKITPGLLLNIKEMFGQMYAGGGIGLAAPQVGWNARVFVMDVRNGRPLALINPIVREVSLETEVAEEGCLSLPGKNPGDEGLRVLVRRPKTCVIESDTIVCTNVRSLKVKHLVHRLEGLEARCAQHEYDHLNGVLIIDKAEK
jgi:peptide deformylase